MKIMLGFLYVYEIGFIVNNMFGYIFFVLFMNYVYIFFIIIIVDIVCFFFKR